MSLTEVLIAMGILTLGLLGVAAVFPVGSFYMARAEQHDLGSQLAQTAMNDLVTRGMLDPRSWFVMTPGPTSAAIGDPNYTFASADGAYAPHNTALPIARPNSFTRPFVDALSAGQTVAKSGALPQASIPVVLSKQFGSAYVIDPMGVAAIQQTQGASAGNRIMYGFPSAACMAYPTQQTWSYYTNSAWDSWRTTVGPKPPSLPLQLAWPIRRVTFRQSSTGYNLDKVMAAELCQMKDDLSYDFPNRDDRPATAAYEMSTDKTVPLVRPWRGDYSWIATVAPSTDEARDRIPFSTESVICDVSVVVLHKRTIPGNFTGATADYPDLSSPERSVAASVVSTGLNGGELLLRDTGDGLVSGDAFKNLKSGYFIMLCGPHPNSSPSAPRFVLLWYQVIAVDSSLGSIITDSTKQRLVTLRGPEWPWQPAPGGPRDFTHLSSDLCVGIVKGAVAVHTRSIALQNSSHSGIAPVGLAGGPHGVDDKNVAY